MQYSIVPVNNILQGYQVSQKDNSVRIVLDKMGLIGLSYESKVKFYTNQIVVFSTNIKECHFSRIHICNTYSCSQSTFEFAFISDVSSTVVADAKGILNGEFTVDRQRANYQKFFLKADLNNKSTIVEVEVIVCGMETIAKTASSYILKGQVNSIFKEDLANKFKVSSVPSY